MSKDLGIAEGRTADELFGLLKPMHDLTLQALEACKKIESAPCRGKTLELWGGFDLYNTDVRSPFKDSAVSVPILREADLGAVRTLLSAFEQCINGMILEYCSGAEDNSLHNEPISGGRVREPLRTIN